MTAEEMWKKVGLVLRNRRKYELRISYAVIEEKDGPSNKTITKFEHGEVSSVTILDQYCTILGLSLPSLLLSVLTADEDEPTHDEIELAERFRELDAEGQDLLLTTARRIRLAPVVASNHQSASGPHAKAPRKR